MSTDPEKNWKTVEFGDRFSLSLPAGVEAAEARGVDTKLFRWRGNGLEVLADIGLFGNPLLSAPRVSKVEVSGREARRLSQATEAGGGRLTLHVPDIDPESADRRKITLSVTASSVEGKKAAERILKSLRIRSA